MKLFTSLLLTLLTCMYSNSQSIADLRNFFNYDPSENLNFHVYKTIDTTQADISIIQYTGGNEMAVSAYLVIPKSRLRNYPAIIFLHGMYQDKNAFLSNALELASNSFASLLIDAPPAWEPSQRITYRNYSDPRKEMLAHRQSVIDVRRGIDLLQQYSKIDPNRIAFVGIGDGSWTGAIVSGIENRILTYILIGCPWHPSDLIHSTDPELKKLNKILTPDQMAKYEETMNKFNPDHYLPHHRNSNILFQYSDQDPANPSDIIKKITGITATPEKLELFDVPADELINFPKAKSSREKWLFDTL